MSEIIDFLQSNLLNTDIVQQTVIFLYTIGAILITVYSIGQFHLLFILLKNRKTYKTIAPTYKDGEWPYVTVQLPMFNELYVAEHVIDACARLDYPSDKLEIQVLDDSTDETLEIAEARANYWRENGVDIVVIHRENRDGFKAGALHEGTQVAKGELIAIFDADFRPNPDFLYKSVGYFQDPKVGVFQGRWGHLNKEYSLLTRAQSLLHDAFFMVEQLSRSMAGYFLRFSGSGGIWRKTTIADAGNWSGDTLSEDYDLCLRAQLKGWKIAYNNDVIAPAELPVTMVDFKLQQYRWTKGRGQVIKKHLWNIASAKLPFMVKVHALFDLLNAFINLGVLALAIFSIPLILINQINPEVQGIIIYLSFALINILLAPWFAWLVFNNYHKKPSLIWKEMYTTFPPFLIIVIAFPFFMTVSLIDGFFNKKSFFHRTSKYNVLEKGQSWRNTLYSPKDVPPITWFEGFFAIFFAWGILVDITTLNIGFLPFHIILTLGYSSLFLYSIRKA